MGNAPFLPTVSLTLSFYPTAPEEKDGQAAGALEVLEILNY